MNNYKLNIYRIVTTDHDHEQIKIRYPTLGICETAEYTDEQTLVRVERALNKYRCY